MVEQERFPSQWFQLKLRKIGEVAENRKGGILLLPPFCVKYLDDCSASLGLAFAILFFISAKINHPANAELILKSTV